MSEIVLISEKANTETVKSLEKLGCEVIPLPAYNRLPQPINSHADMLFFDFDGMLCTFDEYYKENKTLFSVYPQIVPIDCTPSADYPYDIPLNAFTLKGKDGKEYLISKKKNTAPDITKRFESENILNVSQGYAHCSTAVITENAVITADCGIAAVCRKIGADVLLIEAGNIILDGYDYGFIGGAGAKIRDKYIFFGDVGKHPDGEKIIVFTNKHIGNNIVTVDTPLCDFGGAVFIR